MNTVYQNNGEYDEEISVNENIDPLLMQFKDISVQYPQNKQTYNDVDLLEFYKIIEKLVEKIINNKIYSGELIRRQSIDIKKLETVVLSLFSEINFVKQIYYKNIDHDEIKLIVIYDHDDFNYSFHIIHKAFVKIEDIFPNIYIYLDVMRYSKTNQEYLIEATPILEI